MNLRDRLVETMKKNNVHGVIVNINTICDLPCGPIDDDYKFGLDSFEPTTEREVLQKGIYGHCNEKPVYVCRYVNEEGHDFIEVTRSLEDEEDIDRLYLLNYLGECGYKDIKPIKDELIADFEERKEKFKQTFEDRMNYYDKKIEALKK